jgi:hypothetical protein
VVVVVLGVRRNLFLGDTGDVNVVDDDDLVAARGVERGPTAERSGEGGETSQLEEPAAREGGGHGRGFSRAAS